MLGSAQVRCRDTRGSLGGTALPIDRGTGTCQNALESMCIRCLLQATTPSRHSGQTHASWGQQVLLCPSQPFHQTDGSAAEQGTEAVTCFTFVQVLVFLPSGASAQQSDPAEWLPRKSRKEMDDQMLLEEQLHLQVNLCQVRGHQPIPST